MTPAEVHAVVMAALEEAERVEAAATPANPPPWFVGPDWPCDVYDNDGMLVIEGADDMAALIVDARNTRRAALDLARHIFESALPDVDHDYRLAARVVGVDVDALLAAESEGAGGMSDDRVQRVAEALAVHRLGFEACFCGWTWPRDEPMLLSHERHVAPIIAALYAEPARAKVDRALALADQWEAECRASFTGRSYADDLRAALADPEPES